MNILIKYKNSNISKEKEKAMIEKLENNTELLTLEIPYKDLDIQRSKEITLTVLYDMGWEFKESDGSILKIPPENITDSKIVFLDKMPYLTKELQKEIMIKNKKSKIEPAAEILLFHKQKNDEKDGFILA